MKLLEQCQKWNEEDEFQKIIDTLEAIPAGERTPEMDSELAGHTAIWQSRETGSCSRGPLACWSPMKPAPAIRIPRS